MAALCGGSSRTGADTLRWPPGQHGTEQPALQRERLAIQDIWPRAQACLDWLVRCVRFCMSHGPFVGGSSQKRLPFASSPIAGRRRSSPKASIWTMTPPRPGLLPSPAEVGAPLNRFRSKPPEVPRGSSPFRGGRAPFRRPRGASKTRKSRAATKAGHRRNSKALNISHFCVPPPQHHLGRGAQAPAE